MNCKKIKIPLKRNGNRLQPQTNTAKQMYHDFVSSIDEGAFVEAQYTHITEKKARGLRDLAMYWVWIEKMYHHLPENINCRDKQDLHELIKMNYAIENDKIREGWVFDNGEAVRGWRDVSIALDAMSQIEFNAYKKYVEKWCANKIGVSLHEIMRQDIV